MSISRVVFSSKTDQHATPQALFDALHQEFNFVADVAAGPTNHKCPVWFGEGGTEPDGLAADWDRYPGAKFGNPPYSRLERACKTKCKKQKCGKRGHHIYADVFGTGTWVEKAARHRNTVLLLPARTDQPWWHRHVWDANLNQPRPGVEVRFLAGRVRFGDAKTGAPFPSCIVIWR